MAYYVFLGITVSKTDEIVVKKLYISLLRWTCGLSGNEYRVATTLIVEVIIIQLTGQF